MEVGLQPGRRGRDWNSECLSPSSLSLRRKGGKEMHKEETLQIAKAVRLSPTSTRERRVGFRQLGTSSDTVGDVGSSEGDLRCRFFSEESAPGQGQPWELGRG